MFLLNVGCNFKKTTVDVREKLAFDGEKLPQALTEITTLHDCECVILSTCNRVELYFAQSGATKPLTEEAVALFLANFHHHSVEELTPHLYVHRHSAAIDHLFRVTSGLDSLIIGEAQIAGQVKRAYEVAHEQAVTGPLLNAVFQRASLVSKRARTETGIAQGHVSVSSAAVDYVREVFDHFEDKTILVIGAGKMGELTLRHLRRLKPGVIQVTNRSPEKAQEVAQKCDGIAVPWESLDQALIEADVVLSTTGSPEPIMTTDRFEAIAQKRSGRSIVILDIAVPRDFESEIHDGEATYLFNIDDLKQIQEAALADRRKHLPKVERIIEQETARMLKDLTKRRNGPIIRQLNQEVEAKRKEIVKDLLGRLNGRLTDTDKKTIDKAFELFGKRILHGPIAALNEDVPEDVGEQGSHTLLDALRTLFRLQD